MTIFHPEFVIDEDKRKKAVIITIKEWEEIIEDLEELEDIRAYDKTKSEPQDSIPFEQAVNEIREETVD